MSLLPLDLTEVVYAELVKQRRENDHLMHASSHITGSLRHAQLDVAGAPKVQSELLSEITLMTGTMWHEWIHTILKKLGVPYMAEVNMNPWLPPGWGGTLDALIWNPEIKAFVLVDFKTTKGEGLRYIRRDGAKEEHVLQTSAYWHAARKMGVPLAKAVTVFYLPKNDTRNKDELIEPLLVDFEPLPARSLHATMKSRRSRVDEYMGSLPDSDAFFHELGLGAWVTAALEPVQPREQRVYFDKASGYWDLKLVPHWSAAYCPYPIELCDCSTQGTTKLGFYDIDGDYIPRKGFEDVEPIVAPPRLTRSPRSSEALESAQGPQGGPGSCRPGVGNKIGP
jgi:hypothetical protein